MTLKNLVVHVDSSDGIQPRLAVSATLARRFGAHLTGLFAEADSLGSSVVGRRSPQQQARASAKARAAFSSAADAAGVEAEWWDMGTAAHGALVDTVAGFCRYFDLAVFGQHDAASMLLPGDFVEQVLLACGRPLLVVPSAWRLADVGRRVVVGWNASREAARALNDAITLMRDAEFVGVLAFQQDAPLLRDAPPASIVVHLARHGIGARYERVVEEKEGIGAAEALMNYAFESQADLTVLGARGHAFLPLPHIATDVREFLRSMATPVLVAS